MSDSPVPSGSARPTRALDIVSVAFVALLLISNIAATKAFMLGTSTHYLIFDGGAILFPLTYIIGDVLSEVYGFARAKRVIIMGFVASLLASLTFFVVQYLPPAPDYENQDAFAAVLGVVWRAVLASLVGYLAGQLLNSYVLVWIRRRWGSKHLWARLIGSTIVGEAADTILFCTILFYGEMSLGNFINYTITGYFYKVLLEVVLLPPDVPGHRGHSPYGGTQEGRGLRPMNENWLSAPAPEHLTPFEPPASEGAHHPDRGFTIGHRMESHGGLGRTGVIHTAHGTISTPAFIPVGTKANVKALTPEMVRSLGAQAVLANATTCTCSRGPTSSTRQAVSVSS